MGEKKITVAFFTELLLMLKTVKHIKIPFSK